MQERGITVDHATLNRWVVRYFPLIELLQLISIKALVGQCRAKSSPADDLHHIRQLPTLVGNIVHQTVAKGVGIVAAAVDLRLGKDQLQNSIDPPRTQLPIRHFPRPVFDFDVDKAFFNGPAANQSCNVATGHSQSNSGNSLWAPARLRSPFSFGS